MANPIALPVIRKGDNHPNNTTVAVTFGPLFFKRLCAQAKAWGCEPHEAAQMLIEQQLLPPRLARRR